MYVLWLDRIDADALARLSSGRYEFDPAEHRAEFDGWLLSEPELIDGDTADLQRALGVGRYGRSH